MTYNSHPGNQTQLLHPKRSYRLDKRQRALGFCRVAKSGMLVCPLDSPSSVLDKYINDLK
jgi:hypothetical protein